MSPEWLYLALGLLGGFALGVGLTLLMRQHSPARRFDAPAPPPELLDTTVGHGPSDQTHDQNKPLPVAFVQATTGRASPLAASSQGKSPVAMLTAQGGDLDGESWLIRHASSMTIGRFNDCDIAVPDSGVSRLHAQITHRTDAAPAHEFAIFDYSSKNGTILNDQPINAVASLQDGDTIAIGSTTFRFRRIRKG